MLFLIDENLEKGTHKSSVLNSVLFIANRILKPLKAILCLVRNKTERKNKFKKK